VSERRACGLLAQPRGTQRYVPRGRADEDLLTQAIVRLACQYGRYGYRMVTGMLKLGGWPVGKDRVSRIWRKEGLKVPKKQKPRARLWLNEGSCVRLRAERPNQVWSYDLVSTWTHDGGVVRLLTLIDEHSRECLAILTARRIGAQEVIEQLAEVMVSRGIPEHIRSDNGPEFTAKALRVWLATVDARRLYIEPGSPWEKGYCGSFNGRLRDEWLTGEICYSLREARGGDRAVAEGIQHRQAAQFAGLPAACPCRDQPDTAGLGTGGGYAVKWVTEPGTKNQSSQAHTL